MPNADDLLTIAIERAGALNIYWNIFIGVATGILGIMTAGKELAARPLIKALLTAGFVVFAASNLDAILHLNRQREALVALLSTDELKSLMPLVTELKPYAPIMYMIFHLFLDVVVICAIWAFPRPSASGSASGQPTK